MIDFCVCSGNYPKALANYERGLVDGNIQSTLAFQNINHKSQCLAGIARMSIRCGDSRKGVGIAMEADSPRSLRKECAEILEIMKVRNKWSSAITQDLQRQFSLCHVKMMR